MKLGFVGTGGITRAIVTGLLRVNADIEAINLSPRNADIASELASLDRRIRICTSNQDVLDRSDIVCLAVRPQIADTVIRALTFSSTHLIVSFIPGIGVEDLKRLAANVRAIARAVPLPAVASGNGTTALFPRNETVRALFARLGAAVEVDSEDHFDCLHAATATMASYYAFMESQARWLIGKGLAPEAARTFLTSYCAGLAYRAQHSAASFPELIESSITVGGINEKLNNELRDAGAYELYPRALDGALSWINGKR